MNKAKEATLVVVVFMLIFAVLSFTGGYFMALWLGIPGHWPWLVAVIVMALFAHFIRPIVVASVIKAIR